METVCEILDREVPSATGKLYKEQISFVADRPGHDFRYAINTTKIKKDLNWEPKETFDSGLTKTIKWYLENEIRGYFPRHKTN